MKEERKEENREGIEEKEKDVSWLRVAYYFL